MFYYDLNIIAYTAVEALDTAEPLTTFTPNLAPYLTFATQMVKSLRCFSNSQYKPVIAQSVSIFWEENLVSIGLDDRAP